MAWGKLKYTFKFAFVSLAIHFLLALDHVAWPSVYSKSFWNPGKEVIKGSSLFMIILNLCRKVKKHSSSLTRAGELVHVQHESNLHDGYTYLRNYLSFHVLLPECLQLWLNSYKDLEQFLSKLKFFRKKILEKLVSIMQIHKAKTEKKRQKYSVGFQSCCFRLL